MKTICFTNDGLLPPAFFTTFGLSAKSSSNAIGFFGTGLKYAIAILLREKIAFSITSGNDVYTFHIATEVHRDKEFEQAFYRINGGPALRLPFTLELGKTWQLWQAYRELYCNCLDEDGKVTGHTSEVNLPEPQDNRTIVSVTAPQFSELHANRFESILHPHMESDTSPDAESAILQVLDKPSKYLYYQGVRVFESKNGLFRFTYNFLTQRTLTEDRTLASEWEATSSISRFWLEQCQDTGLLHKFLACVKDWKEAGMEPPPFSPAPSSQFMEVIRLRMRNKDAFNLNYLGVARRHMLDDYIDATDKMSPVEQRQLEKATGFLIRHGYPVNKYPIRFFDKLDGGDECMGQAVDGHILLSRKAFRMGTKQLIATILEEYLHLNNGFADCSYPFQNFLFETIVSLMEQLDGEPV